jgi:glycerol-3-phosphate dehydrogenase (NAD(P)+)
MQATASKQPIAVLGAGSWGTALAILLAHNGWAVRLWGHHPAHMQQLERARQNERYLPGFPFPDNLHTETDPARLVDGVERYLLVVPSHAFRETLSLLKHALQARQIPLARIVLAWGTKGLEPGSAKLLSTVAREVLGEQVPIGVVSGPTFAAEVARCLPTAVTAASPVPEVAERIASWLRNDYLRVYTNEDMTGVQLGGSIKNVMAIAAGISDGLGFGANARAALITRGLAEMSRLGMAMGGHPETFMGLAGMGDLILTCTDDQSRNRRVGIGLGRGQSLDQVLAGLGQEAEGVKTCRELYGLMHQVGVEMPITEQVYRVLYEGVSAQQAVEALLTREPRHE